MTREGLETRSGIILIKLSFVFQIDSSADVNVRSLNIKQDGLATPLILASRFDKLYCAYQKNQVWWSSLFLLFASFVAVLGYLHQKLNRSLPSSKNPRFQNEAKCATFLVKMSFICARMKNYFHSKTEHVTAFSYRGPWELGNGLLYNLGGLVFFKFFIKIY